jgi:hypothetical protein
MSPCQDEIRKASTTREENIMTQKRDVVKVTKRDLIGAWTILENLAVSLDQIGSVFGGENGATPDAACQEELRKALAAYLTPDLVKTINEARIRLGQYIPNAEAEALSECIAYWHSDTKTKGPSEAA